MSIPAIETIDLSKIYKLKGKKKTVTALDKINISIAKGEIFGLLGPNGAGKTTLIQILSTIIQPTSGIAKIEGLDVIKKPKLVKNKISLMLGNLILYNRLTGYDNLKFFCKLYDIPDYKKKINNIAKEFGLNSWLNQYVEKYSSGMRLKLALCRTIILDRDIIFLDEPTLGLDVNSISFIIEKLKSIKKTIFLTSHDMNVVEKICKRVAFIRQGRIIKIGTKEDIKKFAKKEINLEIEVNGNHSQLIKKLENQEFIHQIYKKNNKLIVQLNNRQCYSKFLSILSKYNILKISEKESNLEDLFRSLLKS
ncbi:MAG: ABC transporter ATP-binding protein [Promethearchaeota archaeon]